MSSTLDPASFPWMQALSPDIRNRLGAALANLPENPAACVEFWCDLARLLGEQEILGGACDCLTEALRIAPNPTLHGELIEKLAQVEAPGSARLIAEISGFTQRYGENGAVLFTLASHLFAMGQPSAAKAAMARAVLADRGQVAAMRAHPDPAFHLASLPALAGIDLPTWRIARKSAWLGSASPTLSKLSQQLISAQLDLHRLNWEDGSTPRPQGFQRAKAPAGYALGKQRRVLMLLSRYVMCHPDYIETDITKHLVHGSQALGLNCKWFEADEVLYGTSPNNTPNNLSKKLESLSALIHYFDPEIILFDANFIPGEKTIDGSFFEPFRKHGGKVVGFFCDSSDLTPDPTTHWIKHIDLAISLNRQSSHEFTNPGWEKFLYWPGVPTHEAFFSPHAPKAPGLHYIGSASRNRLDWLQAAATFDFPLNAKLHRREKTVAPDFSNYLKFLCGAQMVFNTGYAHPSMSCMTFRIFEVIYAQSHLFEEVDSDIGDYFVPFIHYIPYANIHELVQLAQFFILHPDKAAQIAADANVWLRSQISFVDFWNAVGYRLGIASGD
jgi:hypothetical protein